MCAVLARIDETIFRKGTIEVILFGLALMILVCSVPTALLVAVFRSRFLKLSYIVQGWIAVVSMFSVAFALVEVVVYMWSNRYWWV